MKRDRLLPSRQREQGKRLFHWVKRNPQIGLSVGLFVVGGIAVPFLPTLAGASFGAGASLLGAWIKEFHDRSSEKEKREKSQADAKEYLAPELYRTIERLLYIHDRAVPNFIGASTESDIKPNDLKEDFIPFWPVLYPNAQQFRDLPGEEAVALVSFYDSLHALGDFVKDWWGREGQLPVNIFNMILHSTERSLRLAQVCVDKFALDKRFPPAYEAHSPISERIKGSLKSAENARAHHIARFEAKAAKNEG